MVIELLHISQYVARERDDAPSDFFAAAVAVWLATAMLLLWLLLLALSGFIRTAPYVATTDRATVWHIKQPASCGKSGAGAGTAWNVTRATIYAILKWLKVTAAFALARASGKSRLDLRSAALSIAATHQCL